jgi:hypothetical protein
MLKTHVGCNVYEIQSQKEEHQSFQETAKVSASVLQKMREPDVSKLISKIGAGFLLRPVGK